MRRLYYGRVMRATRYLSDTGDKVNVFHYRYTDNGRVIKNYASPTPEGIIEQLKADGVRVWGSYPLDYEYPQNAYEFWLWKKFLEADGRSAEEINDILDYHIGEGEVSE